MVRRALSNATDVLKKAKTEVATLQGFGDGFDPKLQEYTRELGHILAAIDKLQSET